MRKLFQHISLLCCLGLAGTLGSCTSDDFNNGRSLTAAEVGGEVNLSLNVSIGNITDVRQTRDGEEIPTKFEPDGNVLETEKIKTLRVIIVRPDYTVEFNRFIDLKDKSAFTLNDKNVEPDDLKFLVSTDQGHVDNVAMTCTERKRIYLIANEATFDNPDFKSNFTGDGQTISKLLESLTPAYYPSEEEERKGAVGNLGDKLDPYTVERWIIYNDWAQSGDPDTDVNDLLARPIINNNDVPDADKKSYIPMTEFFDIDVVSSWRHTEAELDKNYDDIKPLPPSEQKADLFVTRNFVKFQFSASSENETFVIKNIRFESLMQKEYLFPFATVYDPVKSINNVTNREIISFQTPGKAGNLVRPYVFTPTKWIVKPATTPENPEEEATNEESDPYTPELYFCETHNYVSNTSNLSLYQLVLSVEFIDKEDQEGRKQAVTYEPKTLPNLPNSLPRNTIVKVNLHVRDRINLDATVTLEPYILVDLEPEFGDPQPWPGDDSQD